MKKDYPFNLHFLLPFLLLFLMGIPFVGSGQNFNPSGLLGENINNPTSLDFGPNGRLYVSQQDGTIWEFIVERDMADPGSGSYSVVGTVAINDIKNGVPNHNDDGTVNTTNTRQVTGILASGTIATPVLYVSSSDSRIGGGGTGNETNLDTNSGVLSRLTWTGTGWDKVDLVRGLPRCEENHSTNGMDLFQQGGNTYLLLQQGGNTNRGAPSNNFAGTSEVFLSGAMLIINLTQLEGMGISTDPRNGAKFIYDLPTLNDPERADIDNTDPAFPYASGHPMFNATIDVGDPFGGNDGLNQAFPEPGGPVQIFSPGYRNAYDVVVTEDGRIYTGDNGPNSGWGGVPVIYTSDGSIKPNQSSYNPLMGDYITNDFNEANANEHGDALHYVGTTTDINGTYFGGHPVPIRAFPSLARVKTHELLVIGQNPQGEDITDWVETADHDFMDLLVGVSGYFATSFSAIDFPNDDRQGEYLADAINSPKVNILDIVNSSTNGICEYKTDNFDGALQGNILTASFNGMINRYELDATGTVLLAKDNGFLGGFGSQPLDVIALSDEDPFPGTIWAATYGADNITVFEPADFGNCPQPGEPEYVETDDSDNDGYTNLDEIQNGTNHCSGGSKPNDFDNDFISDLNDPDDDNDGIPDSMDAFAIDPSNGTTTNLPINYPFWNNDPGTGFFGLGFTGLMLDPSGNTDYLDQYEDTNLSFGGAGGKATVDLVGEGDALAGNNTQNNSFQLGINVDSNSPPFTIHSEVENPFGGNAAEDGQSQGIYMGNGDQDNYLKVVLMDGITDNDGIDGFEVLLEDNGSITSEVYDIPGIVGSTAVDIYISVDPAANTAQPYYSNNGGVTVTPLGLPITLPVSFLDANDNKGMAVGLIATTNASGSFTGTWDFLNITEDGPSNLSVDPDPIDFGTLSVSSGTAQLNAMAKNGGAPSQGALSISGVTITGTDASLFDVDVDLPLEIGPGSEKTLQINFSPDGNPGVKSASLELIHSGNNSPLIIPLGGILSDDPFLLYRVNTGGPEIAAIDGGLNWEEDSQTNNSIYLSNPGNNTISSFGANTFTSEIDLNVVPEEIFDTERFDGNSGVPNMTYSFPVAKPGNYEIRLYMANGWNGTSDPGERIFDVEIEGIIYPQLNDIDLSAIYGHRTGTVISHIVNVTDNLIDIIFLHSIIENPLINGIEIFDVSDLETPIYVDPVTSRTSSSGQQITGFSILANGGDGALNFSATGFPDGVGIDPASGEITGTIDTGAASGSPYNVVVTIDDSDITSADAVTINFLWNIIDATFYRINAGGAEVSATDGGPNWELNNVSGLFNGSIYSVNTGNTLAAGLLFNNRDSSIPAYIDEATFNSIFAQERFDPPNGDEMEFTLPLQNGDYVVHLFFGNFFSGSSQIGERVFDVQIEGNIAEDNLDLIAEFGHRVGGMISYPVTLSDGELNIGFLHEVENPLINAIEVYEVDNSNPVLSLEAIDDQLNVPNDFVDFTVSAAGGDPGQNTTYFISGQPLGIQIEPTNGQIFGTIDPLATEGGPNADGAHTVVVTVFKPNSAPISEVFSWSISESWVDKDEDENYTPRHENSFVQAGDKFYLMGGRENARTIDIYDYTSNSWTSLIDSAPFEFNHFQATEYQGLIWVIGALKDNNFSIGESPAEFVWAFDPANQEWIQGPEIPVDRRRGSAGLSIFNDKFYVVGGNTNGHRGGFVPWFDEYDPATGVWTPLADAPRARDHFFNVVIGDNLYAAGGRLSGGPGGTFAPTIAEVDVYNFTEGTWSTLPVGQNIPTERAGAASINFNDKLVVIGGEIDSQSAALSVTEEYNPVSGTWSQLSNLNFPRHGTQAIVSGPGIFILGGSPTKGGGNQKNMEYFGEDAPVGNPSISSEISAPAGVQILDGETVDIDLNIINGNVGVVVTSIELLGTDAADYNILNGVLVNQLLNPASTHVITVELTGTGPNRNAILKVNYGSDSSLEIILSNENLPPNVTNPGTQNSEEGDSISLQIVAEDAGANLTYSATGLPATLTIDENTGLITGTIDQGTGGGFLEENGLVVMEAESGTLEPSWSLTGIGGTTGIIAGSNHFANQNGGVVPYRITITAPGVYRFNWRSLFSGDDSTVENDNWLRFPNTDGVWFFGFKGNPVDELSMITNLEGSQDNIVFPIGSPRISAGTTPEGNGGNGFFKIFRTGGLSQVHKWQAVTSDGDNHDIYVRFENAGTYTMEISERSAGHAIDKIALYKLDGPTYSNAALTAAPESEYVFDGASQDSPYDVDVTVTDDEDPPLSTTVEFIWNVGGTDNQAPIAIASATPETGNAPLEVTFTGSASTDDVGIVSYLWDFKDGQTSTDINPVHVFMDAGTYEVELTVEDAEGSTNTTTITIIATANQAPVAIASATPETGNAPLEVTFTGNASTDDVGIVGYLWDFKDGQTSTDVDPVHIFMDAGTYEVELTVEDTEGLTNTTTITIIATVNQAPVAIASATPDAGDAPLEVTFTGSTSTDDVGIISYLWDFDDGTTSTNADPVHTFSDPGTYEVGLTVQDAGGLSDNILVTILVRDPNNEPPVASISANPSSGFAPLVIIFDASGSTDDVEIVGYLWDFDDGRTSTEINPNVVFSTPGIYEVTLTVTDEEGREGSANITITVDEFINQPPVARISATPEEGNTPLEVSFTGSASTDDVEIVGYLWNFDDGVSVTDVDPIHTFVAPGNYNVTLTVIDGGGLTNSSSILIRVNSNGNEAPVAIPLATPLSGDVPLEVEFTGSGSTDDNEIVAYLWDFKDGNTSNEDNPTHTFDSPGIYPVELTVTDAGGLTNTAIVVITVIDPNNEAPEAMASADVLNGNAPIDVRFTGSNSLDDRGIVSYFWDFGDGNTATEADPMHTYTNPGIYSVQLEVSDIQGLTDTFSLIIVVTGIDGNLFPNAVASANVLNGNAPLEVLFTGNNSTDDKEIVSYLWDFDDGNVSSEANPVHTFTELGTYEVSLTVEDAEGLKSVVFISIVVEDNRGTLSNDMQAILQENPSRNGIALVQIQNRPSDMNVEMIRLYDSRGRLINSYDPNETLSNDVYEISVLTLRNGLYYISLDMDKGDPMILKLLVRN